MTALLTADEAARLVPGERLVIVRAGVHDSIDTYEADPDWVALTGPCLNPLCGDGYHEPAGCPDCRDGRRIVPLYTECWWKSACAAGDPSVRCVCTSLDASVLAGRGSIEVLPVVSEDDNRHLDPPFIEVTDQGLCLLFANAHDVRNVTRITLDPLPVPGRDFGIVIDCVEVAP